MNARGALDHFPGRDIIFGPREPADRAVSHALWAQGFGVRNTSLSTAALPSLKIPPLSRDGRTAFFVANVSGAEEERGVGSGANM